jgi:hypothetical protein
VDIVDKLAEASIQAAIERGELSNLPGEGKPLRLDDDSMIPEELRAGYRLLKNSGFLPPELQLRKEICEVEQLLRQVDDPGSREYYQARARLEMLRTRLDATRRGQTNLQLEDCYYHKLLERFGAR